MHGFDSLARTRTVQELKTIPVCIFTSSESNADIEKANELKADCYLIKPIDLEKFEATFFGFNTN